MCSAVCACVPVCVYVCVYVRACVSACVHLNLVAVGDERGCGPEREGERDRERE